jgi:hypothetical protein
MWYYTFQDFVIVIGFKASHVNGVLFVLEHQGPVLTADGLYVNDLLMIVNESLIGQIKDQMKKNFWIHDLGSVSLDFAMIIERNQ